MAYVQKQFNEGDEVKICVQENKYITATFVKYTHPFNLRCQCKISDTQIIEDVSIHDVSKAKPKNTY